MTQEISKGDPPAVRAAKVFQWAYVGCAALVLFGGIPILLLGMAYFGGGLGSTLDSFRMGLRDSVLNWLFLLPLALLPAYLFALKYSRSKHIVPVLLVVGLSCVFVLFLIFGSLEDRPVAERPSACHRGVFRLTDGRLMAVSLSPVAALSVDLSDGTRIMTWAGTNQYSGTSCIGSDEGGGFEMEASSCPSDKLNVHTHDGPPQVARRIPLKETNADFVAQGLRFRARLFEPSGVRPGPLVILPARRDGHSRLDWGYTHYMLAGLGVSVFVYDKPGSWPYGRSKTENDADALTYARAAMAKVRSFVPRGSRPVGFYGDRDALLAATHTDADFTIFESAALPADLMRRVSHPILWFYPAKASAARAAELVEALNSPASNITLVALPGVDEHGAWYQKQGAARCELNEPPHYWPALSAWLRQQVARSKS